MDGMTHPVLGAVEVDDGTWRAVVELAGRQVELSLDPDDEALETGQVDTLADVAGQLPDLDRTARAAMLRDHTANTDGAALYLSHHVAELGEERVAAALGIATPVTPEPFIGALRLVRVAVRPDEPLVLDYTIDEELTN